MQNRDGSIIGSKGVTYGLIKPGIKRPTTTTAPSSSSSVLKKSSVFGDDSDDDDVAAQLTREAEQKRKAGKIQKAYEDALLQDSTVFQYDEVYDTIQKTRDDPKIQEKIQRQSKYIMQMKEQADLRKREQSVLMERRLAKEQESEAHLYGDKEKFVTAAYRRKLEEDQKWMEQEKKREEEETRNDVRKVGHMNNFYANLLTKNVAFGSKNASPGLPVSSPLSSSLPQAASAVSTVSASSILINTSDSILNSNISNTKYGSNSHAEKDKNEKDTDKEGKLLREGVRPGGEVNGGIRDQDAKRDRNDRGGRYDEGGEKVRSESRAKYERGREKEGGVELGRRDEWSEGREKRVSKGGEYNPNSAIRARATGNEFVAEHEEEESEERKEKEKEGEGELKVGGKRRNDQEAVLSARERYLARKQQRQ